MINFTHQGRRVFNPLLNSDGRRKSNSPLEYGFSLWKAGGDGECLVKECEDGKRIVIQSDDGKMPPLDDVKSVISVEDPMGSVLIKHALPSAREIENAFHRKFRLVWGESFGKMQPREESLEFFYKSNGYSEMDRLGIEGLGVDQVWTSTEFPDHQVTRLA
jgi:hypothetical protein